MNKLMQAAGLLQQVGASGSPDTILAHITPREAAMLKARGGSGRIDPNTGLPHFEDNGSDSDSTSYGGYSPTMNYSSNSGSYWSGGGSGGGHSDPSYSAKGYYSAAGNYDDSDPEGSGSTRYYGYRQTLGGNIANALGYDPEGFGAMVGNGLISALGFVNPVLGQAGKVAQAYVKSQSTPSPADMDGNGGSMNFIGHLTGSNLLSRLTSGLPVSTDSAQPADTQRKSQSGSSYQSRSSSSSNKGRRKKPWLEETA